MKFGRRYRPRTSRRQCGTPLKEPSQSVSCRPSARPSRSTRQERARTARICFARAELRRGVCQGQIYSTGNAMSVRSCSGLFRVKIGRGRLKTRGLTVLKTVSEGKPYVTGVANGSAVIHLYVASCSRSQLTCDAGFGARCTCDIGVTIIRRGMPTTSQAFS
jgi:hypothetical protein